MNSAPQRLAWALSACRSAQMRLTPLRQAMLAFLAAQRTPVSLVMIAQADGVRGGCDATTIYRTQMLFQAAEIVRQVGAPTKTGLFLLNMPGESYQFLVCRRCGSIKEVALPNKTIEMLKNAATAAGFLAPTPDCEIFSLCPSCVTAGRVQIPSSKLLFCREQEGHRPSGSSGSAREADSP